MSNDWFGVGEALTSVVALSVLPAAVLAGLLSGLVAGVAVLAVGYLFALPATAVVLYWLGLFATEPEDWEDAQPPEGHPADGRADAAAETEGPDALQELRERYARGEIGDETFERELDRLIERADVEVPPGASPDLTDTAHTSDDGDREPAVER